MPFYWSNGTRLHYLARAAKSNGANAMIFQHGIGGDVRQPTRFLAPEHTGIPGGALDVFHADFRGHGQSDLGRVDDLSIATLGHDLAALLDHLELVDAVVGGISMGAAAALRMAVQSPERVRTLVLCRPAWADGPMSLMAREAYALIADLLAAEDWQGSALPALERSDPFQAIETVCPDAAKSLRGQVQSVLNCPQIRQSAIARLRYLPPSRGLDDKGTCLATVRCPTLILATEGDPIHPFEYACKLARHLPNSRLVRIAPKSPTDERPHREEVDRILGEFLSSHV